MNLPLHRLFIQFKNTFESLSRIENYRLRQNKLKELESNYRRFQLSYQIITTSESLLKYEKQTNQLNDGNLKKKNNENNLSNYLAEGLANFYQNKAIKTQLTTQLLQKQPIYNKDKNNQRQIKKMTQKTQKKFVINPYIEREQNFISNQKRKTKIIMKDFIL